MNVFNEFVHKILSIVYYLNEVYDNADKSSRQCSQLCFLFWLALKISKNITADFKGGRISRIKNFVMKINVPTNLNFRKFKKV